MREKPHEISGRTGLEPVVVDPHLFEGAQHAERIVNANHAAAEMIAVELPFQFRFHLVLRELIFSCHLLNLFFENGVQFLFGDAEQGVVACRQTDVVGLVETAEHADLRELGHAGEQHEAQMLVGGLEHRIETFENLTVPVFYLSCLSVHTSLQTRVHNVKQGLVVFVYQHHGWQSCLFVGGFQYIAESVAERVMIRVFAIDCLLLFDKSCQCALQFIARSEVVSVEINMKYRVFFPLLF